MPYINWHQITAPSFETKLKVLRATSGQDEVVVGVAQPHVPEVLAGGFVLSHVPFTAKLWHSFICMSPT